MFIGDNMDRKKLPGIHLQTVFYMAWKNIQSKKLRSLLTATGIVVGIGSITFLVSFGLGLQNIVTKNVIGDKSIKSIDVVSANSRVVKLNADSLNKIRQLPHIEKLGTAYEFPASIGLKGGGVDTVIYGVDQVYQDSLSLRIKEGRLLKKDDSNAVVVSSSALSSIGVSDAKKALNQKLTAVVPIRIDNEKTKELRKELVIVGVLDSGKNSEVFVSSGLFQGAEAPVVKQVKVTADDVKNIPSLRKQIEALGLQTTSATDTLDQINQLFNIFNIILAGFGAIGIFVAILGMFNTLTISLLERTKEIGLMVTLGGRRRDMRRLFMIEAVLLSVIGSVVGVLLAVVGGRILNEFLNAQASTRVTEQFDVFSTPLWLMLVLVGLMIIVGLLVAYFPARRAEKINPIDALRRE